MNTDPNKQIEDAANDIVNAANELADATTEAVEEIGLAPETVQMSADDIAPQVDEQSEIESLNEKLAAAEKQALLVQADMENYRRRSARDLQDQLKYSSMGLISDMLQASDNLDRAIQSAENEADASALLEGVKMVSQQIIQVLASHGCKQIESVGQEFNPNHHEAIQMQPSDEFDANKVMMEIRSGYKLHDRVIRPAQIFVSTGPADQ